MESGYLINERYLIKPNENLIIDVMDNSTDKIHKIEPRIMEVMCMLLENHGGVVMRESIVREVWADYGGGDDGLTQAISILRKCLNDTAKELIETIPKKGYKLNASIKLMNDEDCRSNVKKNVFISKMISYRWPVIWIAFIIFGMIAAWLIFIDQRGPDAPFPKKTEQESKSLSPAPKAP